MSEATIGDPEVPVDHNRVRPPGTLDRADALVRRTVRALALPGHRADARFYVQNIGLFVAFTLALYRVFPKFLMQNVDGVNLYFVLDKLNIWRSSAWETTTLTPLESMTSSLWFPLNPTFIPPFSSFAMTSDPTFRVYLLAIFASFVVFVSSLFFYVSVGFVRPFALGAAWVSFALIMLQDTNLFQGINNVQVLAWAYVCLGLLTHVGKHRTFWKSAVVLLLFQLAVLAYVMGDPVWHITTLPVFGLVALAILLAADSAVERWLKVASLAAALLVQLALQTYVFLFYTVADTARTMLPREYADVSRSASSAGHLFRDDTAAFVIGLLLIVGLTLGHVEQLSVRPRLTNLVIAAAVVFYVIVVAAGYVYVRFPQSPAFRTGYFMEMAYPLAALFIAGALRRLHHASRTAVRSGLGWQALGGWQSIALAVLGVGAYVGWHLRAFPDAAALPLQHAVLAIVGVLLLLCFGWERPAIAVASALLMMILQAHIDESYGGRGGDTQFDGKKRMGLDGNPIVTAMVAETAIRPGDPFRGYVEDLYQRTLSAPTVGDELVGHWLNNWDQYDSGQTLFSWSVFNIPTISEYDPFVRPLYYAFFTRLLNLPTDTQQDNYLGATRPNHAIMELMGVRFIVSDRANLGLPEIMANGKFRVLELPNPNLASYSPTRVIRVSSAHEALDHLQSDMFDPQADVLVQPADELPALVAAPPAELRFQRGGYSIQASSPDWSLLVLPVQFSHCYVLNGSSSQNARLLRVNLVQTGLVVHGDVNLNVDFRHWPLASPECQRQDYTDAIGLRVADVQPPSR